MAVNDVYELVLSGTQDAQLVENVFQYEQTTTLIPAAATIAGDCASGFVAQKLPSILLIEHAAVVYTQVKVTNLFNTTDFATVVLDPSTTHGARGGQSLPMTNNVHFRYAVLDHRLKPGHKQFSGISEADSNADYLVDSGHITLMNSCAATQSTPIQAGASPVDTFTPVIVKRVRSGTPGHYTYRMPHILSEKVVSFIAGIVVDLLISTMNSRKVGVGR